MKNRLKKVLSALLITSIMCVSYMTFAEDTDPEIKMRIIQNPQESYETVRPTSQ